MRQSMNLGIGLILIVKSDGLVSLQSHLNNNNEPYIHLGFVK